MALSGWQRAGKESTLHHSLLELPAYYGNRTYLMQDDDGQILETHSVSAETDYRSWAGAFLVKDIGRVYYVAANDDEALSAFHRLTQIEGIMPALETAHALAHAEKLAADMTPEQHIVVNLSGGVTKIF